MRKVSCLIAAIAFPLVLSACTTATSGNTNVVVIDLTKPEENLNVATNATANTNATVNVNATTNVNSNVNISASKAATTKAVSVTATGFSPATVTVSIGTTVTWTNNAGSDVRVASDPHPTLTDLPGLDSKALAKGATYSFTFTQTGTWGYHNFLEPTQKGIVIVK